MSVSLCQAPSDRTYDGQLADWTAKNARAKAIIMSTLVPGSEPWHIAEPLEYAADIWKALEEKYGPNSQEKESDGEDVRGEENPERIAGHGWQDKLTGTLPAVANENFTQGLTNRLHAREKLYTNDQEEDVARSGAGNTRITDENRRWNTDMLRDQRFLWALLNGGKEKETGQGSEGNGSVQGAAG